MATVHNITIYSGTTFEMHGRYLLDGVETSTVGYRGKMQFRPFPNSPVILFEGNTPNGMVTFTGADAGIHVEIPPAISDAWPFRSGSYDLLVKSPSGRVKRVVQGTFTVDRSTTQGAVP